MTEELYKKLYLHMMHECERALRILIQAQQDRENQLLSAGEKDGEEKKQATEDTDAGWASVSFDRLGSGERTSSGAAAPPSASLQTSLCCAAASGEGAKRGSLDCQAKCNTFLRNSFGERKPRHFLGRLLIKSTTVCSCSSVTRLKFVPLGKKNRINPLMFSLLPRCQGA